MSVLPSEFLLRGIEDELLSYCNKSVFSAASISFFKNSYEKGNPFTISCGAVDDSNTEKINNTTLFDLASLTKPLVTLLCTLFLIETQKIGWSDRLKNVLPVAADTAFAETTVYDLLSHCSGLPSHRNYWVTLNKLAAGKRREWIGQAILNEKKLHVKGKKPLYSDLGYILLGFIIEEVSEMDMACFWQENIARPLEVDKLLLFPAAGSESYSFAATRTHDKRLLRGIVHDDNCRAMGDVCGHAGLFGTALGVLKVCQEVVVLLKDGKSRLPFSSGLLKEACKPVRGSDWTAGFSVPSKIGSSSGNYFSPESIGHLGFTGTSLWIDPVKEVAIVLLTNRVIHEDSQEQIKKARPHIHDLVMTGLGLKTSPLLSK